MKFIRYGSLVPQYHELDDNEGERWFHTAPVEYGFYAFPKGYVEPFLLGGTGSGSLQNGRRKKLRDSNGRPFIGLIADFKEEVKNININSTVIDPTPADNFESMRKLLSQDYPEAEVTYGEEEIGVDEQEAEVNEPTDKDEN